MKTSVRSFAAVAVVLLSAGALCAASVDMKDPRRAVGREGDIRVDAVLSQETLTANSSLGVTYQVENRTNATIAIADKIVDVTYDSDERTVTFAIGSEVPQATMPHLVTIAPGQKRVLQAGGLVRVAVSRERSPFRGTPQLVQIKVNVLRDVQPFAHVAAAQPISDALFDRWVDTNDAIQLNPVPVHWREAPRGVAERSSGDAMPSW